jgi:hypothetical protein
VEASQTKIKLSSLPLGGRLLIRSKKDWRVAVISRVGEENVTISVASPGGYCYRLRRPLDAEISLDGKIPYLIIESAEPWRENFSTYDSRW